MVTGSRKTSAELDKEAAKDLVRSFVRVQASDFFRRRFNDVWPAINEAIDEATANGARVDLPALVREVFLEQKLVEAGE